MTAKSIAWTAGRMIQRFGMHVIPLHHQSKLPVQNDWGNHAISDHSKAVAYFEKNPSHNLGVALGPSRLCSLDIDCMTSFRTICDNFGIDLDALIAETPTIQGSSKGCRLMFRVPEDTELPYAKLNWKREEDSSKSFTVFELRAASGEKQRFDVLPPSVHPDTLQPYKWITQPRDEWPEPPKWMLTMWREFDKFKGQMQSMCPWLPVQATEPSPIARSVSSTGDSSGLSVIDAYCAANGLESELSRYGYKQVGNRWLSPHSCTGLPGVILFSDGHTCWIHHASDPLCSEDSGKPVNSFDLFAYYDHNNDISKAVKHAADILGMKPEPRARIQSAPQSTVTAVDSAASDKSVGFSRETYNLADPLPFCTDKGKPVQHADNLREVIRRIGATVRYNVIRKEDEILCPGQSFSMDNEANASLAWLRSECSLFELNTGPLKEFVTLLADQNLYNPVAEWIMSKPWDRVSRLQDWYDTITGRDDHDETKRQLKETLMRKWGLSAVAAGISPNGISAPGVLTIQGGQYIGKTKWFKSLVPDDLNLVKDGLILRPEDKDSVKQACSFWMVELGELDATFRKADVAALKAFLTNSSDVLRRPYAAKDSQYARRTVFFASVNPSKFLNDPTGNRRYWTIEAVAIDHTHSIDMQQLWAEIYVIHKAGAGYYLTQDEVDQLNNHNEDFTTVDPIEERIQTGLRWEDPQSTWSWITATDALISIGMDRPCKNDATTATAIIRALNGDQHKRTNRGRMLLVPPRMTY
jgi:predicted P-loop ATPase